MFSALRYKHCFWKDCLDSTFWVCKLRVVFTLWLSLGKISGNGNFNTRLFVMNAVIKFIVFPPTIIIKFTSATHPVGSNCWELYFLIMPCGNSDPLSFRAAFRHRQHAKEEMPSTKDPLISHFKNVQPANAQSIKLHGCVHGM